MEYQIENRPVFTTLKIQLAQGESFKAEPGAMVSMSPTIETQAKASGKGLRGALKAAVGGESIFASLYTANAGPGELILAPATPGDIIQFDLNNQTIMAQSGAYMAGNPDLELSTEGSLRAMISGEGLFLQKISGSGTVFFASYGAVFEKKLAPGESYIVDTGHMVAFEVGVTYTVKLVAKGFLSSMASGEGLVCNFTGPGSVWVQSRNLGAFASLIAKLLPNR
jgi:uncharacterized protein (TIGR00266 family)